MISELFQNKYRIPSNRLRGWNYALNGHYFITIVTHNRKCIFGKIKDGKMILNDIGTIVCDQFFKSFEMREELYIGEFVMMPNHLHAIVMVDKDMCEYFDTHGNELEQEHISLETHGSASLQRKPDSISSFVAGFKSSAIKCVDDWIDKNNIPIAKYSKKNPMWQANYYDHIVRNPEEYKLIAEYIKYNPLGWFNDELMQQ